jgi:hypothetical protein
MVIKQGSDPAYELDACLCQMLQHEQCKWNLPSIFDDLGDRFGEALLSAFNFGLVTNIFMDFEGVA